MLTDFAQPPLKKDEDFPLFVPARLARSLLIQRLQPQCLGFAARYLPVAHAVFQSQPLVKHAARVLVPHRPVFSKAVVLLNGLSPFDEGLDSLPAPAEA